jgi:hypothetical protein
MPERDDDCPLTRLQQHLVKTGGRLIKHARCDCQCQWNEAETLTGADLAKKEVAGGVVVKIYSVAVGARVRLTPMAFATVRPGNNSDQDRTAVPLLNWDAHS